MKATKADLAKRADAIKKARRERRIKWAKDSARASSRSLNWMDDRRN